MLEFLSTKEGFAAIAALFSLISLLIVKFMPNTKEKRDKDRYQREREARESAAKSREYLKQYYREQVRRTLKHQKAVENARNKKTEEKAPQ